MDVLAGSWLIIVDLCEAAAVGAEARVIGRQFIFIITSIGSCLPVSTIGTAVFPGMDFQLFLLEVVVAAGELIRATLLAGASGLHMSHRILTTLVETGMPQ